MDKVYTGLLIVDENELNILIDKVIGGICEYDSPCEELDKEIELYTKLLRVRGDIKRERAKFETKTESI
jgi:hypothetical protein